LRILAVPTPNDANLSHQQAKQLVSLRHLQELKMSCTTQALSLLLEQPGQIKWTRLPDYEELTDAIAAQLPLMPNLCTGQFHFIYRVALVIQKLTFVAMLFFFLILQSTSMEASMNRVV